MQQHIAAVAVILQLVCHSLPDLDGAVPGGACKLAGVHEL